LAQGGSVHLGRRRMPGRRGKNAGPTSHSSSEPSSPVIFSSQNDGSILTWPGGSAVDSLMPGPGLPLRHMKDHSGALWSSVLQALLRVGPLVQMLSAIPLQCQASRPLTHQLAMLVRVLIVPSNELDVRTLLGPLRSAPTDPAAALLWLLEKIHEELRWGDYPKGNTEASWVSASDSPVARIFGFVTWHELCMRGRCELLLMQPGLAITLEPEADKLLKDDASPASNSVLGRLMRMMRNDGFRAPGSDKTNTYGFERLPRVLVIHLAGPLMFETELDLVEAPAGANQPSLVQFNLCAAVYPGPPDAKVYVEQEGGGWACSGPMSGPLAAPPQSPSPTILIYVRKEMGRIDLRPPAATPEDFWTATRPTQQPRGPGQGQGQGQGRHDEGPKVAASSPNLGPTGAPFEPGSPGSRAPGYQPMQVLGAPVLLAQPQMVPMQAGGYPTRPPMPIPPQM